MRHRRYYKTDEEDGPFIKLGGDGPDELDKAEYKRELARGDELIESRAALGKE